MELVISNQIKYLGDENRLDTAEKIIQEFTFKNPDYGRAINAQKYGYSNYSNVLPDQFIECFKLESDHIVLPRGSLKKLKSISKQLNDPIQVVNETSKGVNISFDVPYKGSFQSWRPFQIRMIKSMLKHKQGVCVCPTGGGKTLTALGLISALECSALILVDQKTLLKQWIDEVNEKCEGQYTLGRFGGGIKKIGQITVATVQTISRWTESEKQKYKDSFGIVIVDEVHKASAPTFTKALTFFSAEYIIGLSATPKRKDKKEFIFKTYIGPVIEEITDYEVLQTNSITHIKYRFVKTGWSYDYNKLGQDIGSLYNECAISRTRNRCIVNHVSRDIENGGFPIVLSNRVSQCKKLKDDFEFYGHTVGLLIGEMSEKQRDEVKKKAKDGTIDVIIANEKIGGTGLDIPNLTSAHVLFFTTNQVMLKQISGRIRRSFKGKTHGEVYYYTDDIFVMRPKLNGQFEKVNVEFFKTAYEKVENLFKKWGFKCF